MEPMKPMAPPEPWWPKDLGQPSSSGSQDGMRYAFFADAQRLLVENDGRRTTYDTGAHRITGVSQDNRGAGLPVFTSDGGTIALDRLAKVSQPS